MYSISRREIKKENLENFAKNLFDQTIENTMIVEK